MVRLGAVAIALVTLVAVALIARPSTSEEIHPAEAAALRHAPASIYDDTTTTEQETEVLHGLAGSVISAEEELEALTQITTTSSSTTTTTVTTTTRPKTMSTTKPRSTGTTAPKPTTTTTAKPKPAGGFNAAYEAEFARLINGYRSSHGLAPLARHSGLDSYARNWAKYMADNNKFDHSNIWQLLSQGWGFAAENIGRGGSVKGIFDKLKSSAGHSDNMLRDVTHFGIGVYVDGDGRIWTAHVFAR